jgi:4-coumarate--CoA ligase
MTETTPLVLLSISSMVVDGSSGRLVPNMEARFVSPTTGKDVPVGQEGELWVRGPNVMKGYHNNPKATAETIDSEGWLHTGDIGYVDKDGFYYIVDRIKELIKYVFELSLFWLCGTFLLHDCE